MAKRYGEVKRNRERVRRAHRRANMSETNHKKAGLTLDTYRLGDGNYQAEVCVRGGAKRCGFGLASTPTKASAEALEHLARRLRRG